MRETGWIALVAQGARDFGRIITKQEDSLLEGTIKYYNAERRFGLIKRSDGERDIRFLFNALAEASVASASAGQRVEFELVVDPTSNKITAGKLQFK